jgi:hypothetical protein
LEKSTTNTGKYIRNPYGLPVESGITFCYYLFSVWKVGDGLGERINSATDLMIIEPKNYIQIFDALGGLLARYPAFWQSQPFSETALHWQHQHKALYEALLALTDDDLTALSDEQALNDFVSAFVPALAFLGTLRIEAYSGELKPMAKFSDVGIRGRKVSQICGFASLVADTVDPIEQSVVDWCAGKGHLARHLFHIFKAPVICLEHDPALCAQGRQAMEKLGYPVSFLEYDVLKGLPSQLANEPALKPTLITALHACGDLHRAMIETCLSHRIPAMAWSPCCYHLTDAVYQPCSTEGKRQNIALTQDALKLAVSQTATAGNRVKRLRWRELHWRLAFDLLHRDIEGVQQYRPTPSIPKRWLSDSFQVFCEYMAGRLNWSLPRAVAADYFLDEADKKLRRILRLEKAKLAFRRALEYYLVLDQALYVRGSGYQVDIKTFCDTDTSPRNIALVAQRDDFH